MGVRNELIGWRRSVAGDIWCLLFLAFWSPSDLRHRILFAVVELKMGFRGELIGWRRSVAGDIWCLHFLAFYSLSDSVCCNWAGDGIQRWKICSFHFLAFWSPFDVRHRILFVVVELEMEIKWKERRGNKMKGKERFCGRWYWCLLFLASWSPSDVRHQILFAMVKPKRGFKLWVDGLKEVLADYIWCFLFLAVRSPSDVRHRILFAIVKLKLGFGVDRLVGKFCSGYHLMLSFPWYCWGWDSVLIGWGNSETDNIWGFLFLASWYKTLIFVCCGLVQEI